METSKIIRFEERISESNQDIANIISLCKSLIIKNKQLDKDHKKVCKELEKKTRKKKQNGGKKAPSGFAKPSNISDELADFLGVQRGSLVARTEVTKQITQYVKNNELQNPKNRRIILPDNKLQKLLNNQDQEVTYFTLQRFIKHHFPKKKIKSEIASV